MSVTAPTPPPPPPPPPPPYASPPVQPAQPRSGSRLALQVGAIITGVLIILAALNLFSLTAGRSTSTIHRTFGLSGTTLVLHADSADISVLPGGSDIEVDRTARVPHGQTMKEPSISGDVLNLPGDCRGGALGWLWLCSVHYVVHVPANLTLDVQTGSGDLDATGLSSSSLRMHTGSGDVQIRDVDSAAVTAETGSGDVQGRGLASASTIVRTGSGDVLLAFARDPTTVSARTGSGDLTVNVPRDDAEYDVQGKTGSGDYSNGVRSVGQASPGLIQPRFIHAETGSGDLDIGYAD